MEKETGRQMPAAEAAETTATIGLGNWTGSPLVPGRILLVYPALILYVASLFLPVSMDSPGPGWEIFYRGVSDAPSLIDWPLNQLGLVMLLYLASSLTNVVLVAGVPTVLAGRPAWLYRLASYGIVGAALLNFAWLFIAGLSDLRVGYYTWVFSFALCATAALLTMKERSRRRRR